MIWTEDIQVCLESSECFIRCKRVLMCLDEISEVWISVLMLEIFWHLPLNEENLAPYGGIIEECLK